MIQITLSFPSMSAARKALMELPENLFADVEVKAEPAKAEPKQENHAAKKQEPVRPAADEAVEHTKETAPVTGENATPATEPEKPSIDYPTLQKAVFTLAGKSREAAADVAASFGVKTFKDLDSSKWAYALAAVQAKIAELG